ncbi:MULTISPECIES: hypothetical protein [unclassified Phocaeicola]|jgi:putative flippase GtrA|nr:uncharacterized protein BN461_02330 [Bacteroides sp. CAG:1076]
MGTKKHNKKQDFSKQEEQKANRLIKYLCIGLIILAVLIMTLYSLS